MKRMNPEMLTKTGIILGMGEEADEIRQAMADLREAAVDILTLRGFLEHPGEETEGLFISAAFLENAPQPNQRVGIQQLQMPAPGRVRNRRGGPISTSSRSAP